MGSEIDRSARPVRLARGGGIRRHQARLAAIRELDYFRIPAWFLFSAVLAGVKDIREAVEQALKRKDLSGREAFVQLFDELCASLRYRFRMPGEEGEREVAGEELLALLYHPERAVRETAFATYLNAHGEQALVLTACFNNLILDHGKEVELRGYPDRMTPTCLASETAPATLRAPAPCVR